MDQIQSTSDMMKSLQDEIAAVKDGTLTPENARVIARLRSLQLKTVEINIQYNRLLKRGGGIVEMPLLGNGQYKT